jgi:hypothetical protein
LFFSAGKMGEIREFSTLGCKYERIVSTRNIVMGQFGGFALQA